MTSSMLVRKTHIAHPEDWGGEIIDTALSPRGLFVAVKQESVNDWQSQGRDNVFVYDTRDVLKFSFRIQQNWQQGVFFAEDDFQLMVAGEGDQLFRVDLGASHKITAFSAEKDTHKPLMIKAVSQDGRYILYQVSGGLFCRNVRNAKQVRLPDRAMSYARFSPDGNFLSISYIHGKSSIHHSESGETLWEGESGQMFLCFSNHGRHFLVSSRQYPGRLEIWESRTWQKIGESKSATRNSFLYTAASSTDQNKLVTCHLGYDSILLWDAKEYEIISEISNPHSGQIKHFKFSFDDTELISASEKDVFIWSLLTSRDDKDWNVQINFQGSNNNVVVGDKNRINSPINPDL